MLETLDLDFDGRKDLRVLLAKHGQGQSLWQYWLFDAKTGRFEPSPELDATLDARPDTRGKPGLLSAYWNGGAAGRIYKRTTYRWKDGRLEALESEEQTAIEGRPDDFRRTVKRDGKVVEDTVVHDPH